MKIKKPKKFRTKRKFFLRLFGNKCCLSCLFFNNKRKECWAEWSLEGYGERTNSLPHPLSFYFKRKLSKKEKDNFEIGNACELWR